MDLNTPEIQNMGNRCEATPVFFNSLNNGQLKTVNANRFVVHFKAGETIFSRAVRSHISVIS